VVVVSRDSRPLLAMTGVGGVGVEYVDTEVDLLCALTALVVRYVNTRYIHTHSASAGNAPFTLPSTTRQHRLVASPGCLMCELAITMTLVPYFTNST